MKKLKGFLKQNFQSELKTLAKLAIQPAYTRYESETLPTELFRTPTL